MSDPAALSVPILGFANQGDAFAKTAEGSTVFVPHALPGDLFRLTMDNGTLQKAERVGDSPDRRPSYCRVRCGGCAWRELDLQAASKHKLQIVLDTLTRKGIPLPKDIPLVSDPALGYRHRVRLHAAHGVIGFEQVGSNNITPFSECSVARPGLVKRIQQIRVPKSLHAEVDLVHGDDDRVACVIRLMKAKSDRRGKGNDAEREATDLLRDLVSRGVLQGGQVFAVSGAMVRAFGDPIVVMTHPTGGDFGLEAGVFSQGNWALNRELVRIVTEFVGKPKQVLELHAGAGNLTLGFAPNSASVVCTELDPRATMLATRNLRRHGHVKIIERRDEQALNDAHDADVLVLDPPRTGAEKVCRSVGNGTAGKALERLVYVACDPRALARDLELLSPRFTLDRLTVLDMFAGTPHVEAVALLKKAN